MHDSVYLTNLIILDIVFVSHTPLNSKVCHGGGLMKV